MSKLSKNPEDVKQLNQWYLKDNNAVPPTYVLQPITDHFPHFGDLQPGSEAQRDDSLLSWRFTETKLLQLLRSAAAAAEAAGDITAKQKQHFFTSVTEQEFEQGLWKDSSEPSALLFVREIPCQRMKDVPKRLAKYMDLSADGLLDAEAQGLLTGLKSHLYATRQKILNLNCVELSKGSIDPKRKEHARYLDIICEQFVLQMKARIGEVVDLKVEGRRRNIWGSIDEEKEIISDFWVEQVGWHVSMSNELCRSLYGRESLLGKLCCAMWESTNVPHGPLVVHGAAGMGKTALLCKVAQETRSVLDAEAAVVIRLLSAHHPQRPNIDNVLHLFGLGFGSALTSDSQQPPGAAPVLQDVLTEVSQQGNTLLIVLDAVDHLSDVHHAHKLRWMPANLPPNVHLVVSMDTNSEAFANMRLKLNSQRSYFEVEGLSRDEGRQIMESYLHESQRTLTPEQREAVLRSFETTGCPLHLKLILSAAKRWLSFTPAQQHIRAPTHRK
ncbi:hypothetical protein F7725_028337 [Dissostichus mawsoni]|uniref:NACHT domain-containing protein n=1 Tax=Dissostichus mawsoni TaxID=36200 RepID=A0A7J5XGP0_DISMA|nr:hypothetical protein F7725_028337 [Dissostichus mawsoni]